MLFEWPMECFAVNVAIVGSRDAAEHEFVADSDLSLRDSSIGMFEYKQCILLGAVHVFQRLGASNLIYSLELAIQNGL